MRLVLIVIKMFFLIYLFEGYADSHGSIKLNFIHQNFVYIRFYILQYVKLC